MRIVSLLPAATDVVEALGHGVELVGVTHECRPAATPAAVPVTTGDTTAPDVHSPFGVDTAAVVALRPDVVLVESLCSRCPPGDVGDPCSVPGDAVVHAFDPVTLADAIDAVAALGTAIGDIREGLALASHLRRRLEWLERAVAGRGRRIVSVVGPTGAAAHAGWVPDVVTAAGGTSAPPGGYSGPDAPGTGRPGIVVVALDDAGPPPRTRYESRPQASPSSGDDVYALAGRCLDRPGPGLVDGAEAIAWALHRPHPDLRPAPETMWLGTDGGWADLGAGAAR